MNLSVHLERWQASAPLSITGRVFEYFDAAVVELESAGKIGRGEALGIYYRDETAESLVRDIEAFRSIIEQGVSRRDLLELMPAGGARHAIDQALWDLEAKTSGKSIWELAGVEPRNIRSGITIGIMPSPEDTACRARELSGYTSLKLKLDEQQPVERVAAVRESRPDATIHVDANQAWSLQQLKQVAPELARLDVAMIEQPLPRGGDAELESYQSPVPLCADESCLDGDELQTTARRYQMINIKLDKAGGLTHGLEMARDARASGLGLMVGCMGGTSLAMAPAYVLGCLADLVDIDGPPWLLNDRPFGMQYNRPELQPFSAALWG